MKTDFKDKIISPANQKTSKGWFWVVLVCCTVGLFFLYAGNKAETVDTKKNNPFIDRKLGALRELLNQQDVPINKAMPVQPVKEKQTVFNDQNYQPRGAINTIALRPNRIPEQNYVRANVQARKVRRSSDRFSTVRSIPWSWKSHKSNMHGSFTYNETQKGIDTMSICGNYKQGSFIYRDCRKAAKKHFKNACSSRYKAACAAGDMIP